MVDRQPTVIARTVTRTVVPLILLTAIALLLQGHNLPGGGFIAGVLTVTAFALVYIIFGVEGLQHQLLGVVPTGTGVLSGITATYVLAFGLGLGVAAGSGIVAIAIGFPFLTQGVVFLDGLPVYGEFELATALAFDVGVYLVVVGSLLTIISVVGRE